MEIMGKVGQDIIKSLKKVHLVFKKLKTTKIPDIIEYLHYYGFPKPPKLRIGGGLGAPDL